MPWHPLAQKDDPSFHLPARCWAFTINEFMGSTAFDFPGINPDFIGKPPCPVRYIVWAYELAPTTGHPHIQGYIELNKPMRGRAVQEILWAKANCAWRKGPRSKLRDYCRKIEDWVEYGDWDAGGQGTRNDLEQLMHDVEKKGPVETFLENPYMGARFGRAMNEYHDLLMHKKQRTIRKIENSPWNPSMFNYDCCVEKPWSGYRGQKAISIAASDHLPMVWKTRPLYLYEARRWAEWTEVHIRPVEDGEFAEVVWHKDVHR